MSNRKRRLAAEIRELLASDPEAGIAAFETERRRLRRRDAAALGAEVGRLQEAREHREYLVKGLADGSIRPDAGFELLQLFQEAGYLNEQQTQTLRHNVVAAHRAEVQSLLDRSDQHPRDYYRRLDGYRAAGFLTPGELRELERMVEEYLDPRLGARRLFAEAQLCRDPKRQTEMLRRYLVEFPDQPDLPTAAALYVARRVDRLWKALPRIRSANAACVAVLELNSLLKDYLPYTADIDEAVPINRIVDDFMIHAENFRTVPDPSTPITSEHLDRAVAVVRKDGMVDRQYQQERNAYVRIAAVGRVRAVSGDHVIVEFRGKEFVYSKMWTFDAFENSPHHRLPSRTPLSLWHSAELGLLSNRKPSPVEVHQYKRAVSQMKELLEAHRGDNAAMESSDSKPPPPSIECAEPDIQA